MDRPLTERFRADGKPVGLQEYERAAGYQALRKALSSMTPADVTKAVLDSGLRGLGGAGFSTGRKWSFVPSNPNVPRLKFVVCNADEMEPGAFKDRLLMEGDPHQMLEGVILAAYAISAPVAYVFIRSRYVRSARVVAAAIEEASRAGYLGDHILGSGFSLKLHLHTSAGRYICGEASGALNALEGRRPIPRHKPPHQATVGLWSRPTIVNNVETLCNVPHIIRRGADWYRTLSVSKSDTGTKIFSVSGRVKHPGAWELPMGFNMRQMLEEYAGGMQDGFELRGIVPGGASTRLLPASAVDVAMDFASLESAGSRLGTGTAIVLDDHTCPVGFTLNLIQFFAQESCGWCTPCREGLRWARELLGDIERGRGRPGDIELLEHLVWTMGEDKTFCGLAPGAMEPLSSALVHFREDFERHIEERGCPWQRNREASSERMSEAAP